METAEPSGSLIQARRSSVAEADVNVWPMTFVRSAVPKNICAFLSELV